MVMPTTTTTMPLQQELASPEITYTTEERRRGSVFASGCFAIVKADPKSAAATKTEI